MLSRQTQTLVHSLSVFLRLDEDLVGYPSLGDRSQVGFVDILGYLFLGLHGYILELLKSLEHLLFKTFALYLGSLSVLLRELSCDVGKVDLRRKLADVKDVEKGRFIGRCYGGRGDVVAHFEACKASLGALSGLKLLVLYVLDQLSPQILLKQRWLRVVRVLEW